MAITPTLNLNNSAGWRGDTGLVLDHVRAGFSVWSSVLAGEADIRVNVEIASLGTSGSSRILASASINQFSYVGRVDGYLTYESPIAAELKSGNLTQAWSSEVTIRIDATSLSNGTYFIDQSPLTSIAPLGIGSSQYDLLSVMVHEIGHTLGMTGWRSAGGALTGVSQSVFDSQVLVRQGQILFAGENVQTLLGTAALLDTSSVYHFQANDLMDPYAEPGKRTAITRLDTALMADLGIGTVHDDILTTQWGRVFDTGAGFDVVRLDSLKKDLIIQSDSQSVTVTLNNQTLTLLNAERLSLVDADVSLPEAGFTVRFDETGNGGFAFRLYQAALNRTPDPIGLGGWIDYLDKGGDRDWVAKGFTNSAEFSAKYGPLDDQAFVQQLYRNILGREGEEAGLLGWYAALEGGSTRSHVLVGFSEAEENYAITEPTMANGIIYREWDPI